MTDLALLKVPAKGLETLSLGDSDRLKQGQVVLAFGSPLGLGNTVTMGVVSAVARQLSPDDAAVYVQTDAPVNPGNSGGPLVDATGQVVGINTLILSHSGGSEGVGLAIPSNVVRVITDQLRAKGRVRRGMIGVQLQAVDAVFAKALGLPQPWGVIVADVSDDGPAGPAGVQVGDVILSLDGRPVESVRQFSANLFRHAIDATVSLELLRGADRLALKVQVIERPDDPDRYPALIDPKKNLVPQLDILGVDLPDETSPGPAASPSRRWRPGGGRIGGRLESLPFPAGGRHPRRQPHLRAAPGRPARCRRRPEGRRPGRGPDRATGPADVHRLRDGLRQRPPCFLRAEQAGVVRMAVEVLMGRPDS